METPDHTGHVLGVPTQAVVVLILFVAGAGTAIKIGQFSADHGGPSLPDPLWLLLSLLGASALVLTISAVWLRRGAAVVSRGMSILVVVVAFVAMVLISIALPDQFDVQADRDEALEIAANRLWSGLDPWAEPTHVGPSQFPSPFLGGVLVALPFVVATGNATIQMLVVGAIALVLLLRVAGHRAGTAGFLVFATSLVWINEFIFEHDIAFNAILVAIATGWTLFAVNRQHYATAHLIGAGVLLGFGITNRFFFLSVALLLALVLLRIDWRRTISWLLATGLTTLAMLAVPLFLWPTSVERILEQSLSKSESTDVSGAGLILAGATLIVVLLGALLVRDTSQVYLVAGAALALLPIWLLILESLGNGRLALSEYLAQTYWAPCVVFALLGFVMPRTRIVSRSTTAQAYDETAARH